MPEIEISADQSDYLDGLRADLEERYVGAYGTVRPRDALQFLIDRYESSDDDPGVETPEEEAAAGVEADDGSGDDPGDAGGETTASAGDGPDRLQAMMTLLDTHDDKWAETDAEDEKYVVTLPDGETERARTKDDVRALLFRHYG